MEGKSFSFAGDGDDTVTTSSSSTNLSIDAGSGDDSIAVTTLGLASRTAFPEVPVQIRRYWIAKLLTEILQIYPLLKFCNFWSH